ncbi:hypothetical protein NDU88_001079 [Pleurodeles waltl]|uniref:Uncharacterized protein n=1 Tax=Pleurodeles waltl TaxID=8319 RepID=A0AAV7V8R0_PLEWA|nr:hypothetical protein NDU88_001079 [Pleurodeles waltl]
MALEAEEWWVQETGGAVSAATEQAPARAWRPGGAGQRCERCVRSGACKDRRWRAAVVGLALTGCSDRRRGAQPGPLENLQHEEEDVSGLDHCYDREIITTPCLDCELRGTRGLGGPKRPAKGDTSSMVRAKGRLMQQTNKMDNYAVSRRPGDPGVAEGNGGMRGRGTEQDPLREPLLSEIMAAIHDLKGSLEPQLDAVAVDVGLLRADLH